MLRANGAVDLRAQRQAKHEGEHQGESAVVVAKYTQLLTADSPVGRIEAPRAGHPKTSRHGTAADTNSARPSARHFSAGPGELRYDSAAGERRIARNRAVQSKIRLRECAAVAPHPPCRYPQLKPRMRGRCATARSDRRADPRRCATTARRRSSPYTAPGCRPGSRAQARCRAVCRARCAIPSR